MKVSSTYCASVVVPTYKRSELLHHCLTALVAQDIAPTAYEIIIVDDAACAETRQEVVAWAARLAESGHTLRYIPITATHGPAAARNAGWRAATGEIIAFTDDDCLPDAGWLRVGVAAFTADVIGVSGRLIIPLGHIPTDYELNAAQLANAEFVTANCFYRRACLTAIGGFDERFTAAWREDSDLFFSLMQHYGCHCKEIKLDDNDQSGPFIHAPDAIVVHPIRSAPWGISLKQQRKSMFNALLYKKHSALYRQKIQPSPPWHYYGMLAAQLACVFALLRKKHAFAFIIACLWFFLNGRFFVHRLSYTSRHPSHVAEMLITSLLIPPLAIYWRIHGAIKYRVFFL